MTKQEILNYLETKYYHVSEPRLIETFGIVKIYNVAVSKVSGDNIILINVRFTVSNEGEVGIEQAFGVGREPDLPAPPSFIGRLTEILPIA